MIIVEVTKENAREILKRKQNGENICPICVNKAMAFVQKTIFKLPSLG